MRRWVLANTAAKLTLALFSVLFLLVFPFLFLSVPLPFFVFRLLDRFRYPAGASSRIPQFVINTGHSWLEENKSSLERYPDARQSLCDPSSAMWTEQAHDGALPPDLLRRLIVNNNYPGASRSGWISAEAQMIEISNCPAALQAVEELEISIYVHTSEWDTVKEPASPPKTMPPMMAKMLAAMPRLAKLKWGIKGNQAWRFMAAFAEQNLTLPSVRHLVPGAFSEDLVRMCPNLETLEAGGYFHHWSWNDWIPELSGLDPHMMLVDAARDAPNITVFRFRAPHRGWTTELLEEVLWAMPNLKKLEMDGDLTWSSHLQMQAAFGNETEGHLLKEILATISRFPRLEHLHLPDSAGLQLGFDGGPSCGNAYFGADGRSYGREVVVDGVKATELAANITLNALPHLKSLNIGSTKANISRYNDGTVAITWPWTDRLEEYTFEIFPM